jgi:hypothetical protein
LRYQTIILSSRLIEFEQLRSILESEHFNRLNSLKIKGQIFELEEVFSRFDTVLLAKILNNKNVLKTFECSLILSLYDFNRNIHESTINMNIHSLSMESKHLGDALPILKYTPNLKTYKLTTHSLLERLDTELLTDLSTTKLGKFYYTYGENGSLSGLSVQSRDAGWV